MRIRSQIWGHTPVGQASFQKGPQAENCFCFCEGKEASGNRWRSHAQLWDSCQKLLKCHVDVTFFRCHRNNLCGKTPQNAHNGNQ